jgi:hypothetical protein
VGEAELEPVESSRSSATDNFKLDSIEQSMRADTEIGIKPRVRSRWKKAANKSSAFSTNKSVGITDSTKVKASLSKVEESSTFEVEDAELQASTKQTQNPLEGTAPAPVDGFEGQSDSDSGPDDDWFEDGKHGRGDATTKPEKKELREKEFDDDDGAAIEAKAKERSESESESESEMERNGASAGQQNSEHLKFRSKYYDKPIKKHTVPKSAVVAVKIYTGVTLFAAFVSLILASTVYSCGEHTTVTFWYIFVCVIMMISAGIGGYGAFRVQADVAAETGEGSSGGTSSLQELADAEGVALDDMLEHSRDELVVLANERNFSAKMRAALLKEWEAHKVAKETRSLDEDGVDTVGQKILAGYFAASTIGTLLWAVLAAQTLSLADYNAHHNCAHQYGQMLALGFFGFVTAGVYVAQTIKLNQILSTIILIRNYLQVANIFLLILGFMLTLLTMTFIKQSICLTPPDESWISPTVIVLALMGFYGYNFAMVSYMGWVAVVTESRPMLELHGKVLVVWGGIGLLLTVAMMASGVDGWIEMHCDGLLETFSMNWFEEELGCLKYNGPGLVWRGGSWMKTNDTAEIPLCPKPKVRWAWEVNPFSREDGASVQHFGCLDKFCCRRLEEVAHGWKWSLTLFMLFLLATIAITVKFDYTIVHDVRDRTHTKVHQHHQKAKNGVRAFVMIVALIIPFIAFHNECGAYYSSRAQLLPGASSGC